MSQNVLKSDLKKSRICHILSLSDSPLGRNLVTRFRNTLSWVVLMTMNELQRWTDSHLCHLCSWTDHLPLIGNRRSLGANYSRGINYSKANNCCSTQAGGSGRIPRPEFCLTPRKRSSKVETFWSNDNKCWLIDYRLEKNKTLWETRLFVSHIGFIGPLMITVLK